MNFGCDAQNKNVLIKNYQIKGDNLIINFVDGGTYLVDADKEEIVIKEMIRQATEREKSNMLKKEQYELRKRLCNSLMFSAPLIGSIVYRSITENDSDFAKVSSLVIGGLSGTIFLMHGAYSISKVERIKELKKYSIYLKMRQALENCDDENLYNGVGNKELSINTIDGFSLKKVRKVRDNLLRSKRMQEFF